MLNIPTLKFDKSIQHITDQINIQKNNKQLLLDIITNIGLINNKEENNSQNTDMLDSANRLLNSISSNITTMEQLNVEISNINSDLNDIIATKDTNPKTREYYLAAFSNLKSNVIVFTEKLQKAENKVNEDNKAFNSFIDTYNFKYEVNKVEDTEEVSSTTEPSDNYEVTSFSVDNKIATIKDSTIEVTELKDYENIEKNIVNKYKNYSIDQIKSEEESIIDEKISSITNGFKDLLAGYYNQNSNMTKEQLATYLQNMLDVNVSANNNVDLTTTTTADIQEETSTEVDDTISSQEETIEEIAAPIIEENSTVIEEVPVIVEEKTIVEETPVIVEEETTIVEETPVIVEEETTIVEETPIIVEEKTTTNEVNISTLEVEEPIDSLILENFEVDGNNLLNNDNFNNTLENLYNFDEYTNLDKSLSYGTNLLNDEDLSKHDYTFNDVNNLFKDLENHSSNTVYQTNTNYVITENSITSDISNTFKFDKDILDANYSLEKLVHYDEEIKPNEIVETNDEKEIESEIIEETVKDENTTPSLENLFKDYYNYASSISTTPIKEPAKINEVTSENTKPKIDNVIDVKEEIITPIKSNIISTPEIAETKINTPTIKTIDENILEDDIENINDDISLDLLQDEISSLLIEDTNTTIEDITDNIDTLPEIQENTNIIDNENLDINFEDDDSLLDLLLEENNTIEDTSIEETISNDIDTDIENINYAPIQEEVENMQSNFENNFEATQLPKNRLSIDDAINEIEFGTTYTNSYLIISETRNVIYLPYTKFELISYIETYPESYNTVTDVIKQEFKINYNDMEKNPSKSRFSEAYNLYRNRENYSKFKAFKLAFKISKNSRIDPAIIAACKSEYDFDNYMTCLETNNLENFTRFKIIYDVNPL